MNRGEYRTPIEIWEKQKKTVIQNNNGSNRDNTPVYVYNELGEIELEEVKIAETFAKVETRIGSLLSGNRPANTILEKTTLKITFPYGNTPELLPDKNFIKINSKRIEIDYTLNEGFKNIELQVFGHEDK